MEDESQASDVRDSPTYGVTEENATNSLSPGVSDSETSSSSQSGSTVDAADCDSDLEELRALTAEMRESEASSRQRDTRTPHSQEWAAKDQISVLASDLATSQAGAPYQSLMSNRQMETLLQNCCFETIATCKVSEQQNQYVYQMGRDLGQLTAIRLPVADCHRTYAECLATPC